LSGPDVKMPRGHYLLPGTSWVLWLLSLQRGLSIYYKNVILRLLLFFAVESNRYHRKRH